MSGGLTKTQLKQVADRLWHDIKPENAMRLAHTMGMIGNYKRGHEILLWFVRNDIRGEKLLDFFREANGNATDRGVMLGLQKALDFIEGRKVTTKKLEIGDLK